MRFNTPDDGDHDCDDDSDGDKKISCRKFKLESSNLFFSFFGFSKRPIRQTEKKLSAPCIWIIIITN